MDHLKFTVDSALLRELGEKLVETVHLALVELVKNSYDADATFVELIFTTEASGQMQIVISDNGTGMNFDTVKKYWMRIATTNKTDQKVSKVFGRQLSGAKGIGRFSCRRLGDHLKIITHGTEAGNLLGKQAKIQKTVVEFPWLKFIPGEEITSIKCPGSQIEINNETTGTKLIITGGPAWTEGGYKWLQRQLAVLAANRGAQRRGFQDDPGFNVSIIAPGFESGPLVDVRRRLMNAGWGTLKAHVNSNGNAVCKLETESIGNRTITSSTKYDQLKDISLEIAIMVDERAQIRDTSVLSLGTMSKILNEWGGVQVRYKGVRVYPYGDDDWLGIDKDRGIRKGSPNSELFAFAQTLNGVDPGRSLLNMLGMKNYVGNVEIGEKASGFEPKLSREGFMESEAVIQLREFVRFAIDWSTILRDYYIREETLREAFEAKVDIIIKVTQVLSSKVTHPS